MPVLWQGPMIRAWRIPLSPLEVRETRPAQLHAVVAAMLDRRHWETAKPWSLAPLTVENGIPEMTVFTTNDDAASLLLESAKPGELICLGRQEARFLAPPMLDAEVSAEQILALPRYNAVVIRFLTPTTFRRGSRSMPFPEPGKVVNSLRSRWRTCFGDVGADVISTRPEADDIWISDLDGRNKVLRVSNSTVSGFVGRIRYACATEESAALFGALTAMATLTGVGSYTTRTLGRISRERTWG